MAEIVLGIGSSHSPQVSVPWQEWGLLREKDETDPRLDYGRLLQQAKPGIEEELTEERWRQRYEACQRAVARLGEVLCSVEPDVVVIFGDDQHEQFLDDNLPAIAVYHGRSITVREDGRANKPRWKVAEEEQWARTAEEYRAAPELAEHLIEALTLEGFDVARSNRLRPEVGIGHAFSFLYRRLWPGGEVPIVPIMVNTYYPPNQPTPWRCYALGQAVRRAVESWQEQARVVLMASGGLSHVIMDEELDRLTLDALERKDVKVLCSLPRERLRGGTSEILNWVALAGAMEPMQMTLLEYAPGYRSPAATGCGMAFAYWK